MLAKPLVSVHEKYRSSHGGYSNCFIF